MCAPPSPAPNWACLDKGCRRGVRIRDPKKSVFPGCARVGVLGLVGVGLLDFKLISSPRPELCFSSPGLLLQTPWSATPECSPTPESPWSAQPLETPWSARKIQIPKVMFEVKQFFGERGGGAIRVRVGDYSRLSPLFSLGGPGGRGVRVPAELVMSFFLKAPQACRAQN